MKQFSCIMTTNQLPNCPITKADILAAKHIFSPDVGSLKGKTVHSQPHVAWPTVDPLPPQIMSQYHNIALTTDVMYVNGLIPMLVTVPHNIQFSTVEALPNHHLPTLIKGIKSVATMYQQARFWIVTAKMDGKFEPMCSNLVDLGIGLNEAARDQHIGEVEWFICTLKERMRAIYNTLPFTHTPPHMVIEMATTPSFGSIPSLIWMASLKP